MIAIHSHEPKEVKEKKPDATFVIIIITTSMTFTIFGFNLNNNVTVMLLRVNGCSINTNNFHFIIITPSLKAQRTPACRGNIYKFLSDLKFGEKKIEKVSVCFYVIAILEFHCIYTNVSDLCQPLQGVKLTPILIFLCAHFYIIFGKQKSSIDLLNDATNVLFCSVSAELDFMNHLN